MSFKLFRKEVVRPEFPKDGGTLAADVYYWSKHRDRLSLTEALLDVRLFGGESETVKQCFQQSLFYTMKELGALKALDHMQKYLAEWQQKIMLMPLYCLAGRHCSITLGNISISCYGRDALFAVDLDSTKPTKRIELLEVMEICVGIKDRIKDCQKELRRLKATIKASIREAEATVSLGTTEQDPVRTVSLGAGEQDPADDVEGRARRLGRAG